MPDLIDITPEQVHLAQQAALVRLQLFVTGEVHRLLGVPALQFKGSGWYVTDYGKGKGRDDSSGTESGRDTKESPSPAAASDTSPTEK